MLQIQIPNPIKEQIVAALSKAGDREIGGVMMGEQIATNVFAISEITIQRKGGGIASFVRAVSSAVSALSQFFKRTNEDFTRFNYLGEWHSHPSFALQPSGTDVNSMFELVCEPDLGAEFAILMIVKLEDQSFAGNAWVFLPNQEFSSVELLEQNDE